MKRFFAFMDKDFPLSPDLRKALTAKLKKVELYPEEPLPEALSPDIGFYIEKGFVRKLIWENDHWDCKDLYWEGCTLLLLSKLSTAPQEGGLRVIAVEPSILYYFSNEDSLLLSKQYTDYALLDNTWEQQFILQNVAKMELFSVPRKKRLKYIRKYHKHLLRCTPGSLASYLQLSKKDSRILIDAYRR